MTGRVRRHHCVRWHFVRFAWDFTLTSRNVTAARSGTESQRDAIATSRTDWSTPRAGSCAWTGRGSASARSRATSTSTSARGAETAITALASVLSARRSKAHTPLRAPTWRRALAEANLRQRYPNLADNIAGGFNIGFHHIVSTFAPLNSPSFVDNIDSFNVILTRELETRRYVGPMFRAEVEHFIGPFQSSPLAMIPKPHNPNKFRLIQNFSYPRSPSQHIESMNASINSDDFPCTWGTFTAIALVLNQFPPGSQLAVRDVAEAYRTIPLHPSQWPGAVVRVSNNDLFCIDTSASSGGAANCGVFGRCADAACDIMRAKGIGPILKWVNDHMFVRILSKHLHGYNQKRTEWRDDIQRRGGSHQSGGRVWFGGRLLSDGRIEEFVEDMAFPLQALRAGDYLYALEDVNDVTDELGIPWELLKDRDFSPRAVFTGLLWDIEEYTVSLTDEKRLKYLLAIDDWNNRGTHTLEDVQRLHGKLMHASAVAPEGRAYLTCLERMLGVCCENPFKLRYAPKGTSDDILWWQTTTLASSYVATHPRTNHSSLPRSVLGRQLISGNRNLPQRAVASVDAGRWLAGGWTREEGHRVGRSSRIRITGACGRRLQPPS